VSADVHERARALIACGEEASWLDEHLASCAFCREFAGAARNVVRALRSIPVTAGPDLISATQMRVRQRARELQLRQERLWAVWICCSSVTLVAGFTTVVLWSGLSWVAQRISIGAPIWEMGYVAVSLMPVVVVAVLLLARGTHLADNEEV